MSWGSDETQRRSAIEAQAKSDGLHLLRIDRREDRRVGIRAGRVHGGDGSRADPAAAGLPQAPVRADLLVLSLLLRRGRSLRAALDPVAGPRRCDAHGPGGARRHHAADRGHRAPVAGRPPTGQFPAPAGIPMAGGGHATECAHGGCQESRRSVGPSGSLRYVPFVLSSGNNVTCSGEDKTRQINEISQEPEYEQKCEEG
jgi:hypothetical protein